MSPRRLGWLIVLVLMIGALALPGAAEAQNEETDKLTMV